MEVQSIAANGFDDFIKATLATWGIRELTAIQKNAVKAGVVQGQSLIVSAPTSSGKTLVGELGALAGLRRGKRIIYLVSHKALADQKYQDFRQRFGEEAASPLASVGLSTGDREEGESPRVLRRLQILREWSPYEQEIYPEVFARSS